MKKGIAITVRMEITSADPASLLTRLNQEGIRLYDVTFVDEITVRVRVRGRDYKEVKRLLTDWQEHYRILDESTVQWTGRDLQHRWVMAVGCMLLLALALFLPSRIFFVQVEGNDEVPAKLILEQAQQCGIRFGASSRTVRSEKMKNALLENIPQLQWAGVNTSGCVATISVREKSAAPDEKETPAGVSSIVAARDGVITEYTVTNGNPLCQVGQAVREGQTLISGYTDCGIILKATQAAGEVYAQTLRQIRLITPTDCTLRGQETNRQTRYSLLVGKKVINFYKDSGISDSTCVKMYSQDYLTLPGGFQLPLAVITETHICYAEETQVQTEADSFDWLGSYAQAYLCTQMIAGRIDSGDHTLTTLDGAASLTGQYLCTEMIGRTKNEQIIQGDAKGD